VERFLSELDGSSSLRCENVVTYGLAFGARPAPAEFNIRNRHSAVRIRKVFTGPPIVPSNR
jgi:hypothetical protein